MVFSTTAFEVYADADDKYRWRLLDRRRGPHVNARVERFRCGDQLRARGWIAGLVAPAYAEVVGEGSVREDDVVTGGLLRCERETVRSGNAWH